MWRRFQGGQGRQRRAGAGTLPAVRRITIAGVAADAGVGVGTVSRVLNGGEHVRAATFRTVQEAIERLGYRPSHTAAALVRGTPRTVALIVTHLTRPSSVVRVAGALAVLEEQGYDTILCNVESPAERDRHLETLVPPTGPTGFSRSRRRCPAASSPSSPGQAWPWSAWTRPVRGSRRRSSTTWRAGAWPPST